MKTRVVAVHLLNDRSGSPFVLKQALDALANENFEVHIFTSNIYKDGFLSDLTNCHKHEVKYRHSKLKILTLLFFLLSQFVVFVRLLFFLKRKDVVYINTILPFGAALAAKFRFCKVVYHIHEVSVKPKTLKNFLLFVSNLTAKHQIFVSNYLMSNTISKTSKSVIYNALPDSFTSLLVAKYIRSEKPLNILMMASLKIYKGIFEFIDLAIALPHNSFTLILNAPQNEIEIFKKENQIPINVTIYPSQKNVIPFYLDTDIVLNLSRPESWIETFGMTILEGMSFGKIPIAPTVGGPTELILNGENGFLIDGRNTNLLVNTITKLEQDKDYFETISTKALTSAKQFNHSNFCNSISSLFTNISKNEKQ